MGWSRFRKQHNRSIMRRRKVRPGMMEGSNKRFQLATSADLLPRPRLKMSKNPIDLVRAQPCHLLNRTQYPEKTKWWQDPRISQSAEADPGDGQPKARCRRRIDKWGVSGTHGEEIIKMVKKRIYNNGNKCNGQYSKTDKLPCQNGPRSSQEWPERWRGEEPAQQRCKSYKVPHACTTSRSHDERRYPCERPHHSSATREPQTVCVKSNADTSISCPPRTVDDRYQGKN